MFDKKIITWVALATVLLGLWTGFIWFYSASRVKAKSTVQNDTTIVYKHSVKVDTVYKTRTATVKVYVKDNEKVYAVDTVIIDTGVVIGLYSKDIAKEQIKVDYTLLERIIETIKTDTVIIPKILPQVKYLEQPFYKTFTFGAVTGGSLVALIIWLIATAVK